MEAIPSSPQRGNLNEEEKKDGETDKNADETAPASPDFQPHRAKGGRPRKSPAATQKAKDERQELRKKKQKEKLKQIQYKTSLNKIVGEHADRWATVRETVMLRKNNVPPATEADAVFS